MLDSVAVIYSSLQFVWGSIEDRCNLFRPVGTTDSSLLLATKHFSVKHIVYHWKGELAKQKTPSCHWNAKPFANIFENLVNCPIIKSGSSANVNQLISFKRIRVICLLDVKKDREYQSFCWL